MASLSRISLLIQKNNTYNLPIIEINPNFIQPVSIPESVKKEIITDINTFKINEIIEIPNYLSFLDKDNYYLYGTPTMFHSILFIIDEQFRLGSIGKQERISELKNFLLDNLEESFGRNKSIYSKQKIKKKDIETYLKELLFSKVIEPNLDVFNLIADTHKLNIYLLDTEKKLYSKFYSDNSSKNIILVYFEDHIIPLLSIHSVFFSDHDIGQILSYFGPKLLLNKLNSYKLPDLQLLANNNNISITNSNSNKNKSKQQLYDDLLILT